MKRYLLLLLLLLTCSPCYAGYTVIIREQISPKTILVHGVGKMESALNPGPVPTYPATVTKMLCAAKDIYSPTAADRFEVWEDSAGTAASPALFAACPQIREAKKKEIRSGGSARLLALATPYSAEERESWPQQKEEALEFQRDQLCTCAMIRNMANTRGIAVNLMVDKILENADLFKAFAGQILGKQQRLIDQIEVETDFATLLGIGW